MNCYGKWQKGKNFIEQDKPLTKIRSKCSVQACEREYFGKMYCKYHYYRLIEKPKVITNQKIKNIEEATPDKIKKIKEIKIKKIRIYPDRFCTENECILKHYAKSLCKYHYDSSKDILRREFIEKRKPFILKKGYKRVRRPAHPRSDKKGYIREHIIVMEKTIGRYLLPGEVVHHVDGNKENNNPENLMLFSSHTEHMKIHNEINKLKK